MRVSWLIYARDSHLPACSGHTCEVTVTGSTPSLCAEAMTVTGECDMRTRYGAYFVAPVNQVQTTFNAGSSTQGKSRRVSYVYGPYGNVTQEKLYGDIATSSDDRLLQRGFLTNTVDYIVNKPAWEKLWAGLTPGAINAEKSFVEYAYDNLAYGTAPSKGNLTKTKNYWQAAPNYQFYETTTIYDTFGRPSGVTDGRGNTTTSAYHSFYGYVTSVTNDLGQYNHTYVYNAIGNITSNAGNAYTYSDAAHKHAVTAAFGNTYGYDANGNQTTRTIGGITYTFTYDYENRVTAIAGGSTTASFVYDASGMRVKGTVNGITTVFWFPCSGIGT